MDSFTLSFAHKAPLGLDCRTWCGNGFRLFDPHQVVGEIVPLLKNGIIARCCHDRYAGEWATSAFAATRSTYACRAESLRAIPGGAALINAQQVQLPEHAAARSNSAACNVAPAGGRETVDHRSGS